MRGLLPASFGQSPYGAVPTVASIGAVTRDSIVAAQREGWGPKGATLIVTGALSPEAGFALAERVFGDWAGDGTPVTTARAVPFAAPRIVAIAMPGAGQAAVLSALPSVGRGYQGRGATRLAQPKLGGGVPGRLHHTKHKS